MKALGKLIISVVILFKTNILLAGTPIQITSFADIIEPLMPSIVNIYTIKYNRQSDQKTTSIPEILPIDKFNNFCENYNVPFSFDDMPLNSNSLSLGAGFIVDEQGYIMTSYHVISGSDEIYIKLLDNTEIQARVIGIDPKTDLALLKIDINKKLIPAKFADSDKVRVGDVVIAIGNPLGFGRTVTTGIISSKGRDLGLNPDDLVDDFLQTDAAINSGNSGGPLYNIYGNVIGINTSVLDINSDTNIGISFAIPSNTIVDIMEQLKAKGKIRRGRLDINVQEVTQELADALSLKEVMGVLVTKVKPGGVGYKAGLKQGDLITKCNDQNITTPRKLQLFIADSHIDDEVSLTILRNAEPVIVKIKITEVAEKKEEQMIPREETIKKAGITFSNLSPLLLNKLDLEQGAKGVIVIEIDNSKNADLKIGDLILAIDQKSINNIEEFNKVYQEQLSNSEKSNVILLVKRGDNVIFSTIQLK